MVLDANAHSCPEDTLLSAGSNSNTNLKSRKSSGNEEQYKRTSSGNPHNSGPTTSGEKTLVYLNDLLEKDSSYQLQLKNSGEICHLAVYIQVFIAAIL